MNFHEKILWPDEPALVDQTTTDLLAQGFTMVDWTRNYNILTIPNDIQHLLLVFTNRTWIGDFLVKTNTTDQAALEVILTMFWKRTLPTLPTYHAASISDSRYNAAYDLKKRFPKLRLSRCLVVDDWRGLGDHSSLHLGNPFNNKDKSNAFAKEISVAYKQARNILKEKGLLVLNSTLTVSFQHKIIMDNFLSPHSSHFTTIQKFTQSCKEKTIPPPWQLRSLYSWAKECGFQNLNAKNVNHRNIVYNTKIPAGVLATVAYDCNLLCNILTGLDPLEAAKEYLGS